MTTAAASVLGAPLISQTLMEDLQRVGRRHKRWTVQAYFELDGPYLVEYCRDRLEILPMPTIPHQRIAQHLNRQLLSYVATGAAQGDVLFAGTRVQVAPDTFREPDVLFIPAEWRPFVHHQYTERAGLVIEVVSEEYREHDTLTKREEYAAAGIPEYWIVDPELQTITVLRLDGDRYAVHGEFGPGQWATSAFLQGFRVDVSAAFAAAQP